MEGSNNTKSTTTNTTATVTTCRNTPQALLLRLNQLRQQRSLLAQTTKPKQMASKDGKIPPPARERVFVYTKGGPDPTRDIIHAEVHPSVTVIPDSTFEECITLQSCKLHEGLKEIGYKAFFRCKALRHMVIPSTVTKIGEYAVYQTKMDIVNLSNDVTELGRSAFCDGKFVNFKIPPLITTVPDRVVGLCKSMFSLEMSENVKKIDESAFVANWHMRNVAIPPNCVVGRNAFDNCNALRRFGTEDEIVHALKHRFDGLPIHKMLYYQPYNKVTAEELSNAIASSEEGIGENEEPLGMQQDFMGMTPLHILAASTVQDASLYRVLIDKYPENLITEDRWGYLPIFWAAAAPAEIRQLLIESYKLFHPHAQLNWSVMLKVMGSAMVIRFDVIQNIFDMYKQHFSDQAIDWLEVLNIPSRPTPRATFRYLFKCSVSDRIAAIEIKSFRKQLITNMINEPEPFNISRRSWIRRMNLQMARFQAICDRLKDNTAVLVLAVWKAKINESKKFHQKKKFKLDESLHREECRINCGSDIIVDHVLPYLLPYYDDRGLPQGD